MKRAINIGLHLGLALAIFGMVRWLSLYHAPSHDHRTKEDYKEECQSEGCDGEEVRELDVSYKEECIGEGCDIEEVIELAGGRGSVNAMLRDFQSRGFTVTPCSFIPPVLPANVAILNVTQGDAAFSGGCTPAIANTLLGDFDMDQEDWDDGLGFGAPCNVSLPLGRTISALRLLRLFGPSLANPSVNFPTILPFFYSFSSSSIDELDGRCGQGNLAGTIRFARTFTGAQDNSTELYWGFFYALDVPSRAAVIVHEARHANGGPSHNCTTCSGGGSCDSSWQLQGSRFFEVDYLLLLRTSNGGFISAAMSTLARAQGNALLASAFCTRPRNKDVLGANAANPNAFFSIP